MQVCTHDVVQATPAVVYVAGCHLCVCALAPRPDTPTPPRTYLLCVFHHRQAQAKQQAAAAQQQPPPTPAAAAAISSPAAAAPSPQQQQQGAARTSAGALEYEAQLKAKLDAAGMKLCPLFVWGG